MTVQGSAKTLLFMPDLFSYMLSGSPACEQSIASTSLKHVGDGVCDVDQRSGQDSTHTCGGQFIQEILERLHPRSGKHLQHARGLGVDSQILEEVADLPDDRGQRQEARLDALEPRLQVVLTLC